MLFYACRNAIASEKVALSENRFDGLREGGVCSCYPMLRKGVTTAMRYQEQIVVRCTTKLRRRINTWAKQNDVKPGELTRRVLERAFGIDDQLPLPPGIVPVEPAQEAPGKS